MRYFIVLAIVLLFSGCFSSRELPAMKQYTFASLISDKPLNVERIDGILKVDLPRSTHALGSQNILYNRQSFEENSYVNSQWSESANVLLQKKMVAILARAKIYDDVVGITSRARATHILESELVALNHRVYNNDVQIIIHLTLIDDATRKVIKSKQLEYYEGVKENSAKGAVEAMNRALKSFETQLLFFMM
jgi:ABC-type uncharacterized transport system auxiliary subunit